MEQIPILAAHVYYRQCCRAPRPSSFFINYYFPLRSEAGVAAMDQVGRATLTIYGTKCPNLSSAAERRGRESAEESTKADWGCESAAPRCQREQTTAQSLRNVHDKRKGQRQKLRAALSVLLIHIYSRVICTDSMEMIRCNSSTSAHVRSPFVRLSAPIVADVRASACAMTSRTRPIINGLPFDYPFLSVRLGRQRVDNTPPERPKRLRAINKRAVRTAYEMKLIAERRVGHATVASALPDDVKPARTM